MYHTFTYRHSELPPVRAEIKAEIVALDCQIADLILKSQGNYRELDALAETLGNSFDSCQSNLQLIRIIADDDRAPPPTPTMKELPIEEKELIYSLSFTNSLLLNVLLNVTGKSIKSLAKEIALLSTFHPPNPTREDIENFIAELLAVPDNVKDGYVLTKL